jgi:hypothetical protein
MSKQDQSKSSKDPALEFWDSLMDTSIALEERQFKLEVSKEKESRRRAGTNRRDDMFIHGVRGLLILNGGGAVALLAFLGSVWGGNQTAFAGGIIDGLFWLILGCGVAGVVHFSRYFTALFYSKKVGPILSLLNAILAFGSLGLFLYGMWVIIRAAPSVSP